MNLQKIFPFLWDELIKVLSRFHLDKFLQKLLKPQLFDTAIGRSMWPCNCLFNCNVDYWRALQLIDMLKKKHRIHFMTKSYNTFCKQGYACILVHSNKIYLCSLKVCKCKRVKENFAENHWIHSSSEIIEWKKAENKLFVMETLLFSRVVLRMRGLTYA